MSNNKDKKIEYAEQYWALANKFIKEEVLSVVDSKELNNLQFIYKIITYWQAYNVEWAIKTFGPVMYDIKNEIVNRDSGGLKDGYFSDELDKMKSFTLGNLANIKKSFPIIKKIIKSIDDDFKYGVASKCLELYISYQNISSN